MASIAGSIIVLSGPSGVGKDTLIQRITEISEYRKFVAYTTRPSRPNEKYGIDYFFLNEAEFAELIAKEEFLDHLVINGYNYGTPLKDFFKILERGHRVILHLAAPTAILLKQKVPQVTIVFVVPPSWLSLIERLRKRGMSEEQIDARMRIDPTRIEQAVEFDLIVVNHDNEESETAQRIVRFLSCV
jgi:guanylate kinase